VHKVISYIRLTADYSRLVSGLAPSPIAGVRALTRVHAWSGMCWYRPFPVPPAESGVESYLDSTPILHLVEFVVDRFIEW
jgi:hypothetical protein